MRRCLAALGLILPVALLLSAKKPPSALLSQLESELKDREFATKVILGSTYGYCWRDTSGQWEAVHPVDTEVRPSGAVEYRVRINYGTRQGCVSNRHGDSPYHTFPSHVTINELTSLLPVGERVRVTKIQLMDDRIEFWLNGSEQRGVAGTYAKIKLMLGKGFEASYDRDGIVAVVSNVLYLERYERMQALKSGYPQLKEKLATAESRYKAAQGDARSRVQAAQQFQSALQELVKNRTDYDSLTQTASDPERDQYARQAADLEKSIQALDQEAKKQRAEEIRKTLSAEAEEAAHIRAQLRQKKPGSLAEWEQQMAFLQRWEELLHRCQTLHGELAETGEGAPASETAALQQGFQEIQTLRAALEGQRQTLRLVELDNQYREMDRQRRQLMDAYTRVFGTPRQRPGGEKLYIHLHQMNENRTEAQHLGSEQAAGQAAGLQKEMDRLQRQIGPVQVPARSTPPATLRTRPPSPTGSEAPPPAVLGSAGPKRIRVAGSVIAGKLIFQPQPEYPPLARMARIQGEVRLEVVVDKEATVQDVKVLSGHPLLVKAAIEAVSRWRYQPTLFQGQPVEVLTEVEQGFSLTD